MEFNDYLNNCKDDDILCSREDKLFKIEQVKQSFQYVFSNHLPNHLVEGLNKNNIDITATNLILFHERGQLNSYYGCDNKFWFTDGVCCKILRAGSNGWQEGKLRLKVTLEFCPDEPEITQSESPLDDIRQSIEQNK